MKFQTQHSDTIRTLAMSSSKPLALCLLTWVMPCERLTAQRDANSFSGEAVLVDATDLHQPITGPIRIGDSGQLSPVGGVRIATVPFTNVMGLLILSNGSATVVGGGILESSSASF